MKAFQHELPDACDVFNLAVQCAPDPWRIDRERMEQEQRRRDAAAYQERMQRTLAECPGFYSCDAPSSEGMKGRIGVYPSHVAEAAIWLKRRFHTSENLELSHGDILFFEIAPRIRRVTPGRPRRKVSFGPVQQFELALA